MKASVAKAERAGSSSWPKNAAISGETWTRVAGPSSPREPKAARLCSVLFMEGGAL